MAEEIINRVAKSKLKTLDLEDFYPKGQRIEFDISDWLFENLILKEVDFREQIENHNWEQYTNCFVALHCSTDAIIPSWAYLLLTTKLQPYAKKVVIGSLDLLETVIFEEIIKNFDISEYHDKPVILKGCSNKSIPPTAYSLIIYKLQPVVKSLLFGEACSTVPLFKRKK